MIKKIKTRHLAFMLSFVLTLSVFSVAHASLRDDLKGAFNDMKMTNRTPAGVYKGQTALHFSGGAYSTRTPVRTYQIASVQLPSASAGCGGIDLRAGGFGFISGKEMIAMLKNIASNAEGMVYKLGIDIVSAQLGDALSTAQDWAQRLNSMQINSCDAATQMVGGAYGLMSGVNHSCITNNVTNKGMDWVAAKDACSTNPTIEGATEDITDAAPFFGNVMWHAMHKVNAFNIRNASGNELQLPYFAMALSGTFIRTKTEAVPKKSTFLQATDNKGMLDPLLYGGKVTIYECDDDKTKDGCTKITEKPIEIKKEEALFFRVNALLKNILTAIENDTEIKDEELALLEATRIPLWTMLTTARAVSYPAAVSLLDELSEIIARDMLVGYLNGIIKTAIDSSFYAKKPDSNEVYPHEKSLLLIKDQLADLGKETNKQAGDLNKMIERTYLHKKLLISKMPASSFKSDSLVGTGR